MNKTNSEISQEIAYMHAKLRGVLEELGARTSAHEACIKQLESTKEQLKHMKNLYDAERVFHQKVTDALGDERAAHAKTRARLDTLLSGMVVLPELVAPAEWEPVFFTNPDGIVNIGLSKGKFDVHGRLCVIGGHIAVEWCSVKNRDHHSQGWRKEWEPTE